VLIAYVVVDQTTRRPRSLRPPVSFGIAGALSIKWYHRRERCCSLYLNMVITNCVCRKCIECNIKRYRIVMSVSYKWYLTMTFCRWLCLVSFIYLCLFSHSGVQHILCCGILLFFLVLYTLCFQFLWIVNFWFPLRYSLTLIYNSLLSWSVRSEILFAFIWSVRLLALYLCPT